MVKEYTNSIEHRITAKKNYSRGRQPVRGGDLPGQHGRDQRSPGAAPFQKK